MGQKPVRIAGISALWWNEKCKLKLLEFRESRENPEKAAQAWKRFRATVKGAKSNHWRKQILDTTMDTKVLKVMHWAKPKPCREPPSLKVAQ